MGPAARGSILAILLVLGLHSTALAGRIYISSTHGDVYPQVHGTVIGIDAEGSDGTKGGGLGNDPQRLLGLPYTSVVGLAVDPLGDEIYWTDSEWDPSIEEYVPLIRRASPNACETLQRGVPGASFFYHFLALDLDNDKLYWTEGEGLAIGRLRRSNLDGSATETLVDGLNWPGRLRLDVAGGKVYWIERELDGRIGRADLDGTNEETVIEGDKPRALAIDPVAGKLYWTSGQLPYMLRRANLNGSNPEDLFELSPWVPIDVDPQREKVYWAISNGEPFGGPGSVHRANFDGSNPEIVSVSHDIGGSELLYSPVDIEIGPYFCASIAVPALGLIAGALLVIALLLGAAVLVRR